MSHHGTSHGCRLNYDLDYWSGSQVMVWQIMRETLIFNLCLWNLTVQSNTCLLRILTVFNVAFSQISKHRIAALLYKYNYPISIAISS